VYSEIAQGVAFDEKPAKAELLAIQRPTWSVFESDCVESIRAGAGEHLEINLIDIDPYGEPWPMVEAWFASERPWPDRIGFAINDGVRMKLKITGGWDVESLKPAVQHFGNSTMYGDYLSVARWNLKRLALLREYELAHWTGYYCGHGDCMTHYAAVFDRFPKPSSSSSSPASSSSSGPKASSTSSTG
jgi:hypothetical protein